MVVQAYILVQTNVGKAAEVARAIGAISGVTMAEDVTGPYDVIVLTGSTPVLPEAFQKSLKTGGRLFAVTGDAPVMQAVLVTCVVQKEKAGVYNTIGLFETCISPLKNAMQPERFTF